MIQVTFKYLLNLRERAGRETETVEFEPNSTRADLVRHLASRGIGVPDPSVVVIVNGVGWNLSADSMRSPLSEGDTVCLFHPLSGG